MKKYVLTVKFFSSYDKKIGEKQYDYFISEEMIREKLGYRLFIPTSFYITANGTTYSNPVGVVDLREIKSTDPDRKVITNITKITPVDEPSIGLSKNEKASSLLSSILEVPSVCSTNDTYNIKAITTTNTTTNSPYYQLYENFWSIENVNLNNTKKETNFMLDNLMKNFHFGKASNVKLSGYGHVVTLRLKRLRGYP